MGSEMCIRDSHESDEQEDYTWQPLSSPLQLPLIQGRMAECHQFPDERSHLLSRSDIEGSVVWRAFLSCFSNLEKLKISTIFFVVHRTWERLARGPTQRDDLAGPRAVEV